MKRVKNIIFSAVSVFIVTAYIYFSESISEAVIKSINICLTVIIPSIYGFMIISSVIMKSGMLAVLSRPFRLVSEYIFRLPCELFSVFLISTAAGYPVGIKMIYALLDEDKIDRQTADYMSCFCFAGGPAFILGLCRDKRIAMIIFASITISNIITALIMRFGRKNAVLHKECKSEKTIFNASVITESVESSAKSMLLICAMITGFSVFSAIADNSGITEYISEFISFVFHTDFSTSHSITESVIEISRISEFDSGNYSLIPLITALLAFGGLCVTVQVISVSGGRLNIGKFLFSRLISSVSAGMICRFILSKTDICISAANISKPILYNHKYSVLPSVFLIIMTIILLNELNSVKNHNLS